MVFILYFLPVLGCTFPKVGSPGGSVNSSGCSSKSSKGNSSVGSVEGSLGIKDWHSELREPTV